MAAYGNIERPKTLLLPPLDLPFRKSQKLSSSPLSNTGGLVGRTVSEATDVDVLRIFHLQRDNIPSELMAVLYDEFSLELGRGNTYPQEGPMTMEGFKSYFASDDVFVGIALHERISDPLSLEAARADRPWSQCVWGAYYVKPNYPGRSSHICNAGFLVCTAYRGRGVGGLLGQSYLHFAPKLGYKASIFNLVYASNTASVALWDRLGFTRIGLIPNGGRLKQVDGSERFVDAYIVWKQFEG